MICEAPISFLNMEHFLLINANNGQTHSKVQEYKSNGHVKSTLIELKITKIIITVYHEWLFYLIRP